MTINDIRGDLTHSIPSKDHSRVKESPSENLFDLDIEIHSSPTYPTNQNVSEGNACSGTCASCAYTCGNCKSQQRVC